MEPERPWRLLEAIDAARWGEVAACADVGAQQAVRPGDFVRLVFVRGGSLFGRQCAQAWVFVEQVDADGPTPVYRGTVVALRPPAPQGLQPGPWVELAPHHVVQVHRADAPPGW